MEKDLIVAIFTPTTKRNGGGVWGTGCPVTGDLILTARHVVAPDDRDSKQPIRVCWFYSKSGDGQPPNWSDIEEDIVWIGEGDLDAALIRCPRPESLRRFPLDRLVECRPRSTYEWESAGFARADKLDGMREPGHFGGKVRSMAEGDAYFELVEIAKPERKEQWKGASGMPVCVGSEILGIVKQVPPNYGWQKLDAVPSWRLLKDDEFRQKLGIDDQERPQRARQLLCRLLEGSDEATRSLAAALNRDLDLLDEQKLPCDDMAHCREQVVDTLLKKTPPLEQLLELALDVQDERRMARDPAGARVASDLVLALLPAIHDAGLVMDVRRNKADTTVCMVPLPTRLPTVAEIIMAGADLRAAKLRPARSDIDFPSGEASLSEPPESGRDANGEQFKRDLHADLIERFAAGKDIDLFAKNFRDYLKERFIPRNLRVGTDISEQELLDTVRDHLRDSANAKNDSLTYYFTMAMRPTDQKEQVLKELKTQFEHIAFLYLKGSHEPLNKEVGRFGRLRRLLYNKAELST